MQLGSYVFNWDPTRLSPIERVKPVGSMATFGGSQIFQFSPVWPGVRVTLEWDYMPEAQFTQLRILYLSSEQVLFVPDTGETFNVIVVELTSKYFEVANSEQPYREDVKMVLEVRTQEQSTTSSTA